MFSIFKKQSSSIFRAPSLVPVWIVMAQAQILGLLAIAKKIHLECCSAGLQKFRLVNATPNLGTKSWTSKLKCIEKFVFK